MPVGSNFAVDIGIHVGKLFEIVAVASLDYEGSDLEIAGAVDGRLVQAEIRRRRHLLFAETALLAGFGADRTSV